MTAAASTKAFAVLQIPTIVSSVTFLAAATSIPDAVSSMAVARKGRKLSLFTPSVHIKPERLA